MNITLQSDAMRELMRRLAEAEGSILGDETGADNAAVPANTETSAEEPAAAEPAPEVGTENQTTDDADIEKVMTEPRDTTAEKFSLGSLADDLGLQNATLFKTAFNQLRSGTEPTDPDQLKELAAAFTKLMSTDTSNAQKVVNRLRKIYKKPIS
jgi:hypothetical protein